MALDPAGAHLWLFTPAGLTQITLTADPLAIGEVQYSPGSLTVLASGLNSSTTVAIDGQPIPGVNVVNSMRLLIPLPSMASGSHSLRLTNSDGETRLLPLAFTVP